MADKQDQGNDAPRKKFMDSRWLLWGLAGAAIVLGCITATVAFGFRTSDTYKVPEIKSHESAIQAGDQPLLTVVQDSDGDVSSLSSDVPSTAAASALQSQNVTTTPQSTVSEQAQTNAIGASLNAAAVSLQAGVSATVNALTVNTLGL